MNLKYFKKIKLPDKPGVYFFKQKSKILYIGKATSLRDRTKSYFSKDLINTRGPLILDMVFKANNLKWEVTDSVLEALVLEANLIKKHQPYYNTREKDDKSFNYVVITKEKLPKVNIVRGSNLKNFSGGRFSQVLGSLGPSPSQTIQKPSSASVYYGPYTSGSQLREAMKIIRKIFPFLDDKSKNYMEFYKQINLVPDLDNRAMYLQNIRNIKLFFSGKKKQILVNLKKEMKECVKRQEFEKAGEIKRQMFALQHINDIALLKSESSFIFSPLRPSPSEWDPRGFKNERTIAFRGESENILPEVFKIEAYDIAHMGGKNMVGVMTVVSNGEVDKSEYKKFRIKTQTDANDTGALMEVLERRLTHREWPLPSLIVVDGGIAQINVAKQTLTRLNLVIPIVSVVKDERHKPRNIMGDKEFAVKYKREILLANSEAHRFAIAYHKKMRNKNFLK